MRELERGSENVWSHLYPDARTTVSYRVRVYVLQKPPLAALLGDGIAESQRLIKTKRWRHGQCRNFCKEMEYRVSPSWGSARPCWMATEIDRPRRKE